MPPRLSLCKNPHQENAVRVADSGVWIDDFNEVDHPACEMIDQLLDHGEVPIVVPDLVLFEVLRGLRGWRN